MPALADRVSLVVADPRGMGLSDKPGHGYDTGSLAQDMIDLVASFGHTGFSVVGARRPDMDRLRPRGGPPPGVLERMFVAEAAIPGLTPSAPVFNSSTLNEKLWHFAFNRLPALNEVLVRGHEYR
jgi:hypothetical protein